jgi:lipopolysaccharide/colanic/teichoic acid biosynthesis glycosyltransferase
MLLPLCAYRCAKRTLDIVLSATALLVLLPLFIPLIIILRLTGEGKVFYRQERVGHQGNRFGLLKFATMLKNSPNIGTGTITTKNDPRVLPLGGFLRKTKLNELPQLLNVLNGDMSIIGPRPLTPDHFDYYSEDVKKVIGQVPPGLSGVGSIVFRDEESVLAKSHKPPAQCYAEDIAPCKGRLEVWYVEHRSFWLDLKLIFITVWVIAFPRSELYRRWLESPNQMLKS